MPQSYGKTYVHEMHLITVPRNCHRCGLEFRADPNRRVCFTCKKPKTRVKRPPSKRLSLRENQVVDLVSQGKLNKEIAFQLHLSEMTIKVYMSKIFQKVGVTNRTELAVWALTRRRESAA
jgi:DNA-binding NarL/FixJ family response regulator